MFVTNNLNNSINRAVLHALPTSILVLDSNERIILANLSATRLLKTQREYLEGGSLSRFLESETKLSSTSQTISFNTPNGNIDLIAVSKEIVIEDDMISVVLLRSERSNGEKSLTRLISDFPTTLEDPFSYICQALLDLGITKYACVRRTNSNNCEILASTTPNSDTFSNSPSIARTISRNETTHIEIVIVPDPIHGLNGEDLSTIDMFISLLNLSVGTQETASDASGSETALALALKAGDMGMAFFDISRNECYLSDRLATWCSINPESFSGITTDWLASFRDDDKQRVSKLFDELESHKKFKTVINLETLEQDMRLELTGRPLEENSSGQWVVIARPFTDEEEVQAAWQTRIAMEESARVEAEELLDSFEKILLDTLLPTTSDVSIQHSRQDAGTWHIARPLDTHASVYCVGAVTAESRSQAIIDSTVLTTIADVLASQVQDVDKYVALIRDHARARDIETTIAAVRVVNGHISSATHGGASVFISGRSFTGSIQIAETTALSLSSHSQATTESIEVASNGRPWRIMTSVVEVVSVINTNTNKAVDNSKTQDPIFNMNERSSDAFSETVDLTSDEFETLSDEEQMPVQEELEELEDLGTITGQNRAIKRNHDGENVMQFRSGSINPNS